MWTEYGLPDRCCGGGLDKLDHPAFRGLDGLDHPMTGLATRVPWSRRARPPEDGLDHPPRGLDGLDHPAWLDGLAPPGSPGLDGLDHPPPVVSTGSTTR